MRIVPAFFDVCLMRACACACVHMRAYIFGSKRNALCLKKNKNSFEFPIYFPELLVYSVLDTEK